MYLVLLRIALNTIIITFYQTFFLFIRLICQKQKAMESLKKLTTKQIINIILIILLVVFVLSNMKPVPIGFFYDIIEIPLVILITFVFFIGYFVGKTFTKKDCKDKKKEPEKIEETYHSEES